MQSCVNPKGGKSGEFFFFTYDSKLIIKTVKESEFIAYKNRIEVNLLY